MTMTQREIDRLVCPLCGEQNLPGMKPMIEEVGYNIVCQVCSTKGHPALFMPWLERLEDSA